MRKSPRLLSPLAGRGTRFKSRFAGRQTPSPLGSSLPSPRRPHAMGTGGVASSNGPLRLENVLDKSQSPYVRGHMNNPVHWQMWSPEALDLAKKHNRLIFVSIGYAACHWCHVMERESFENDEVANVLNEAFIPIKVDREERPDIDRIYMNYVQATVGRGGWPMSVFLTPNLEPVFGGTYFPGPDSAMASSGATTFLDLLHKIQSMWQTQPERLKSSAKQVTQRLKEFAQEGTLGGARTSIDGGDDGLDIDLMEEAYQHFQNKFDATYGGFGSAPKFPTPANLSFLLSLSRYSSGIRDVVGEEECIHARSMVLTTLRNMTRGGIHDQIGNGFARYSVTKDWSLPHFEKMLYDQGQLLNVYVDAFLITGDAEMLGAVYDIATYLTTPPLAAPTGGFYSSEDADSYSTPEDTETREGAFYAWTYQEFQQILGERNAAICAKFYNVKERGNVAPENDAHEELLNQNVLAISSNPDALSKKFGVPKEEVVRILKEGRQKLLKYRNEKRPRPNLDDKIVVAWNGIAIGALARTSSVLEAFDSNKAEECRDAAVKAVNFIKKELYDPKTHTMKRVYRQGPGTAPAFADDYAFMIQGLLELYEATFDDSYLQFADNLQKTQTKLFYDSNHSGYFATESGQDDIILRLKDGMDNAEPSTTGVSASNLYRLSSFFEDASYASLARKTCEAFGAEIMQHPFLFGSMMSNIVAIKLGMRTIVITGSDEDDNDSRVQKAIDTCRARLKMNTTMVRLDDDDDEGSDSFLLSRNKLLQSMNKNRKALMICEGGTCSEVLDINDVEKALEYSDGG